MMQQTWRWFGPVDKVTIDDMLQAGVQGVVTALHHLPPGKVWSREDISKRKAEIATRSDGSASGLQWEVVESLPVSEDIKTAGPDRDAHIAAWQESLQNLADEGPDVICYNFMPVLDWIRTDLAAPMPSGARALRFDLIDFAAFDIHVVGRREAKADFPADVVAAAKLRAESLSPADRDRLAANILAGLPGALEHWTLETLRDRLAAYDGIDAGGLRENLAYFLSKVVPLAESLGLRLCCHPDDPPWPLMGLPRILSSEADYQWLIEAAPSPANGITFCTGSLGARADNDLSGMVQRLGPQIHFLHLRNVRRESPVFPGSFHEAEHLNGDTDMVAVARAVLAEQDRRRSDGRSDWQIPMRPDHGQEILDDRNRRAAPGYPAIGRLRGLAELRGVMLALGHRS